MPDFAELGLWANAAILTVAAIAVWYAGAALSRHAAAINQLTGMGQAVTGIIVLAGVTSLPEIGVTATAAISGIADLAVNNLFGSIALQVALLGIVDLFIGRDALTSVVPEPSVMLEGSLNIILISFAAAAMIVGDVGFAGAGLWSWGCLLAYVVCVKLLADAEGKRPWLVAHQGEVDHALIERSAGATGLPADFDETLSDLLPKTAGIAAVILVAGFVLARSGEAVAELSGLGGSFVGFALIAFATSLPEFSTTLTAAARGLYTMAISDILGTNLINIALIFLVDILYVGQPVLSGLGDFAVFGALLAVILTALFLAGLAERRNKSVLRMGYDSLLVLAVYSGGIVFLYNLRPDP